MIYILSDGGCNSRIKIGKTIQTEKELYKRYHTALPNCKILKYYMPNIDYNEEEKALHLKYSQYRVTNNNGNFSEWFDIPLHLILELCDNKEIQSINSSILIEWFESKKLIIPNYQRRYDEKRIDEIKTYIAGGGFIPPITINIGESSSTFPPNNIYTADKITVIDGMHRTLALAPNINVNLIILRLSEIKEVEIFNNINKSVSCPIVYLNTNYNILKNELFCHLERDYKSHISQSKKPICPNFNSHMIIDELFNEFGAVKYLQSINKFDEKQFITNFENVHKYIHVNMSPEFFEENNETSLKWKKKNRTEKILKLNEYVGKMKAKNNRICYLGFLSASSFRKILISQFENL